MQERLPLPASTVKVTGCAMPSELGDVAGHRLPSPDLAGIVRPSPAHVIAAIPLEPAPRIVWMDPSLAAPVRERLGRIDTEVVDGGVVECRAQLGVVEPAIRKLAAAIGHVLAAEDAQCEHPGRRQLGAEGGVEMLALRLRQVVDVSPLHAVL